MLCIAQHVPDEKRFLYNNDDVLEHTLKWEQERRSQRREEREFNASANTLLDILTDYANADN